jgi:hypothetical protein
MTVADTIAKSFLLAVETRGDKTAIREKHLGVWQSTSWRQWLQTAKEIAYALHASGFKSGDVASIIANATPEWVFADMGVLCAGGVSSGIYPTDSASQVEYLINDRTKVIFAEDDEQLDKILACRARCPTLEKIVVFDMEGLSGFSDPMVLSLDEFLALGRNHMQGREALWNEMIESRSPNDLAILVYTSGTTGPPKGAMHSNRSVVHQMRYADYLLVPTDHEERLVFLPLCHVAERIGGYYLSIAVGSVMNFAESPETVPDNLREVQPTASCGAAHLGKVLFGHHHCAEGCDTISAMDVSPCARHRTAFDGIPAGRRYAAVASASGREGGLLAGVPQHPPDARARPRPHRLHGCGADLAGPDPLVSRHWPRHARGLWPDRELRRGDADAERPHQARFRRQGRALGRGDDLPQR